MGESRLPISRPSTICRSYGVNKGAKAQNWENYKTKAVGGEVAEELFERGLCLPSGTAMTNGDLDRVIDTILNCRKK